MDVPRSAAGGRPAPGAATHRAAGDRVLRGLALLSAALLAAEGAPLLVAALAGHAGAVP